VVEVVTEPRTAGRNRKLPSELEWATQSCSRNRSPLDEREQALNPLRHRHQPVMPQHAAVPIVIQSFCITPILAFFNSFWVLSRHLSRLDNTQKLLHDNEGSG
jgi:hypothetical protein